MAITDDTTMTDDVITLGQEQIENTTTTTEEVVDENIDSKVETKTETTDVETQTDANKGSETQQKKSEKIVDDKTKETQTDDDSKENGLEISFNGKEFKTNEDKQKPDANKGSETQQSQVSLSDESVLNYLKEKGIEVNSLNDLSKPLPDEVEKFKKYYEETGRGHSDYYNSQKDWTKVDKDDTIRAFYKSKHPNMSDEDIEQGVRLLQVTEEDADTLTEAEISARKFNHSKTYNEALQYMTEQSAKYKTNLGNSQKEQPKQEIDYKPYWKANQDALEKFNEFNINLKGLGDIKLPIKQEYKDAVSQNTHTVEDFFKQWQNDKGLIDNELMVEDMTWADRNIRPQLLANMLQQMEVLVRDRDSKENRNVNLNNKHQTANQTQQVKKGVEIIGENNSYETGMGIPII